MDDKVNSFEAHRTWQLKKILATAHLAHAIAAQTHRDTKAMARAKSPPAKTST